MSEAAKGLVAIVIASAIFGFSSLYYKLLDGVPPVEILAHRSVWSCVALLLILAVRGRLNDMVRCFHTRRGALITLSASVLISVNWLGFILAIHSGRALQASLGYYIFPLVAVLLGMVMFGDRLRPLQLSAVTLACVAVGTLIFGLGIVPYLALLLAITFGLYGAIKRGQTADVMASVGAEVCLIAPVALTFLLWLHLMAGGDDTGQGRGAFGDDPWLTALLMMSGPLTAAPLLLFSYAAQRISMPTLGLVQYLNPTLQFLCAVLIFGEIVTPWHMVAFVLIWIGLAIYSYDGWKKHRTG